MSKKELFNIDVIKESVKNQAYHEDCAAKAEAEKTLKSERIAGIPNMDE